MLLRRQLHFVRTLFTFSSYYRVSCDTGVRVYDSSDMTNATPALRGRREAKLGTNMC